MVTFEKTFRSSILGCRALAWFTILAVLVSNDAAGQIVDADSESGQSGLADNASDESTGPLEYIAPKQIEMRIGLRLSAGDGNMISTMAMTAFPSDWPEQKVEVLQVNVANPFRHAFRELPGGNKQLLFQARTVPANSQIEATLHLRIEKTHIVGPTETTQFTVPRRLPREAKQFLGNSPFIEATSSEIKKVVREVAAEDPLTEWDKVELLYDWVRENIQYQKGKLKTVRQAMRDRTGDCEEMTGTFVALCRAARIPARCVWIPNHCYAEFYMEDGDGNGTWFPCQLAGTRNFGSMPEYLPILQKGDRFKVPEKKELQRYLADYLKAQKVTGRTKPQVEFVRELLGDAAKLDNPDRAAEQQPSPAVGN
ncbi:MAG: transglutaminase domain-containing protein [Planctomycetota bacterium]